MRAESCDAGKARSSPLAREHDLLQRRLHRLAAVGRALHGPGVAVPVERADEVVVREQLGAVVAAAEIVCARRI